MPPSRTVAPYAPARTPPRASRPVVGHGEASASFPTGYERDRGAPPPAAQSDQDEGTLPQRGGRSQADLPRHHQRGARVDANAQLDDSPARVQDPLRRPTTGVTSTRERLHRKSDALR